MRRLFLTCTLAAFAALALAWLPYPAAAQQKAGAAKTSTKQYPPVPRTADGKPDFNGVWQSGNNRIGTWEQANGGNGEVTPNPVTPNRDPLPYQPWAATKVLESFNRRGIDDPAARCLPPGVPRAGSFGGLFPMQIIQSPKTIVILYEAYHEFRVIPLDAKHPEDIESSFMGDSVGHWDGDTLVVDVTGFNDETWLGPTGSFHSEELHVTERYTRVDFNTIHQEVTVEDPKVLTKPWIQRTTIMLRPGTRLREYACAQNNVDMERYEKLLKDESVFRRK